MARAISSLPVPVSPWIRTVESVGATRSTCSSTASSAGLLPMSCSNLRSRRSWSMVPYLSTVVAKVTSPKHAERVVLTATFHSRANTLEQGFVVKRFCQELYSARSQRLHPHFGIAVRGDEDGGNPAMLSLQPGLQLQPGHSWHADIRDQTCSLALLPGLQKFLCRCNCLCRTSH